jgi:hypothetical protein
MIIDPKVLLQQITRIPGSVGPRPIAFASTDTDGTLIYLLLVSLMYLVQTHLFLFFHHQGESA